MPSLWYVGVGLEIISTMSGTVGKQLIRLSELAKSNRPQRSKLLLVGGLVINTVLGPVIDMAAYSFAAQSLVAPFGGLDVVWNAALAPYILGETLTKGRMLGCALIMVGTVMAGCFGNHAEPEYTIEYIEDTLLNFRNLVYALAFLAWFLLNRFWLMQYPVGSAVRGISLGCTAGTIAGNMFCVKGAIELIQRSLHEQDGEIWLHWLPYVLLIGAVFFAVSNVGYMTKGLQEYEALFMVTIYEGSMIVSGCVSGAVVLLDLKGLEAWRVLLYSTGVLTIVAGMQVIFYLESRERSSLLSQRASIETPSPSRRSCHATVDTMVDPEALEASTKTWPSDKGMLEPVPRQIGRGLSEKDVLKEQLAKDVQITVVKAAVCNGQGVVKALFPEDPAQEPTHGAHSPRDKQNAGDNAATDNASATPPPQHSNTSIELRPGPDSHGGIFCNGTDDAASVVPAGGDGESAVLSGEAPDASAPAEKQPLERISVHLLGPQCCIPSIDAIVPVQRRPSTATTGTTVTAGGSGEGAGSSPSRRRQGRKKTAKPKE